MSNDAPMQVQTVRPSMKHWDAKQTSDWVRAIGPSYSAAADLFQLRAIDGPAALTLDDPLLTHLGISDSITRHVLLSKIKA